MNRSLHRRHFLKRSAAAAALAATVPYWFTGAARADDDDQLTTAAIGVGGRGRGIGNALRSRSNMVACCDVDANHANRFSDGKLKVYEDYRQLLDDKSIEAITCGTPDHWHTPIVLAALHAGKDVYCEKPLTLTVDEGKMLCQAVKDTGRILQVGTQQRTEYNLRFLRAVVMAQSGRLGKIRKVTASIGGGPAGGPFEKQQPPSHLNWDFWLGQAPKVEYIPQRCHGTFRWWYEYSGGKMTDWGAHHVDIAQWAIGMQHSGPVSVEGLSVTHPVEFQNGYPTVDDRYNTATQFQIRCVFPNDVELLIQHAGNGILIEGDKGRIAVNRGSLTGKPIEDLEQDQAEREKVEEEVVALFEGRQRKGHMDNFLDAVKDRKQPMADVFTHHRALTTCHLANIAIRLGRKINWDPSTELSDDQEINDKWLKREHREGYAFQWPLGSS
jgi:predicted dehydrogenase